MEHLWPPEKAIFHSAQTSQNHTMQWLCCANAQGSFLHFFLIFFYSKTFELILYLSHYEVSVFFSQANSPIRLPFFFFMTTNNSPHPASKIVPHHESDKWSEWMLLNIKQLLCITFNTWFQSFWFVKTSITLNYKLILGECCFLCIWFQHGCSLAVYHSEI